MAERLKAKGFRGSLSGLHNLRKNSLKHGFPTCGKSHVLCQGTTLVGPHTMPLMRALAPEFLLSWSAQSLSAASKSPGLAQLQFGVGSRTLGLG
jgi:hypothetical protein